MSSTNNTINYTHDNINNNILPSPEAGAARPRRRWRAGACASASASGRSSSTSGRRPMGTAGND